MKYPALYLDTSLWLDDDEVASLKERVYKRFDLDAEIEYKVQSSETVAATAEDIQFLQKWGAKDAAAAVKKAIETGLPVATAAASFANGVPYEGRQFRYEPGSSTWLRIKYKDITKTTTWKELLDYRFGPVEERQWLLQVGLKAVFNDELGASGRCLATLIRGNAGSNDSARDPMSARQNTIDSVVRTELRKTVPWAFYAEKEGGRYEGWQS